MRRKVLGIAAAFVLAIAGTGMLASYVSGADDRAMAGEERVDVLVVAQKIDQGTPAGALGGKVKLERVPAKVRAQDAVTTLTKLRGLVATMTLLPGEQLLSSRFAKPGDVAAEASPGASGNDTAGLLKISVELESQRVMGGTLRTGDTVAVFVSDSDLKVTRLVLHQVPVTAIYGGSTFSADGIAKSEDSGTKSLSAKVIVTLAVASVAAQTIVWGMEHGSLWLSLEPSTADQSLLPAVDLPRVFQ